MYQHLTPKPGFGRPTDREPLFSARRRRRTINGTLWSITVSRHVCEGDTALQRFMSLEEGVRAFLYPHELVF
jgi:hypothetical protein